MDTGTASEVPVWARFAGVAICWGLALTVLAVSAYAALNPQPIPWTEPEGFHFGRFVVRMLGPALLVVPLIWAGWLTSTRWRTTRPAGSSAGWAADLLVAGAYAVTLGLVAHVFAEGTAYQLTGGWPRIAWWQLTVPGYVPFTLLAIRQLRARHGGEGVRVAVGLWVAATAGLFMLYVGFIADCHLFGCDK